MMDDVELFNSHGRIVLQLTDGPKHFCGLDALLFAARLKRWEAELARMESRL
jgi:hypothetical protein